MSLSATNIASQYSAGAAINALSGFTNVSLPTASRLPQVTVGGSHTTTTYTITGTSLGGDALTQTLTVGAGAGTSKFGLPMATVTEFSSNADPGDTVDLEWGDTWVEPAGTLIVGTAGDVTLRAADDDTDVPLRDVPAGIQPLKVKIVRMTGTTAADLALGWS